MTAIMITRRTRGTNTMLNHNHGRQCYFPSLCLPSTGLRRTGPSMLALPQASIAIKFKKLTSLNCNINFINCRCYTVIISCFWSDNLKIDRQNVYCTKQKTLHDLSSSQLHMDCNPIIIEWNVVALFA